MVDTDRGMHEHAPSYSRKSFDVAQFARVVAWALCIVKRERFEAITGCGHSGLLIVGAVAFKAGIPGIAVRKKNGPDSRAHDSLPWHGVVPDAMRYAFIDDIVASGTTLTHVVDSIRSTMPDARLSGIMLYSSMFCDLAATRLNVEEIPRFGFDKLEALNGRD